VLDDTYLFIVITLSSSVLPVPGAHSTSILLFPRTRARQIQTHSGELSPLSSCSPPLSNGGLFVLPLRTALSSFPTPRRFFCIFHMSPESGCTAWRLFEPFADSVSSAFNIKKTRNPILFLSFFKYCHSAWRVKTDILSGISFPKGSYMLWTAGALLLTNCYSPTITPSSQAKASLPPFRPSRPT
jgi:hypothetical protein